MTAYIVRRLFHGIFVLLGLMVVVFVVSHLIGDLARLMLPLDATEEQYFQLRDELGLDEPLYIQFLDYVAQLARGDFGTSHWQDVPAMPLVLSRLPATLYLAFASMVFALIIAVPLGILSAAKPRSIPDRIATILSMLGLSVPTFWLALMLIAFVALNVGWFRTSGYGGPQYLILPMIALCGPTVGRLVQVVRSSMLEVMNKPYLTTARAKGLGNRIVIFRHGLRNALLPVVTLVGDDLAGLINGAVVIEVVFGWPGIGMLMLQAIERRDFPVIQAVVLLVATLIVAMNLLVDIAYVYIDPRIRFR